MKGIEIDFSSKTALLIEDMAEARILQKKMLQDFGFKHIEIAMKAESAIDLLKRHKYDVILSDYNLGNGKDGQQLLEEIRHSNLVPHTSTYLMVTAETSIEMVMGAIEFQPDGYITKPFSQAMLQRRLLKLLKVKAQLEPVNSALDASDYEDVIRKAQSVAAETPVLVGKCQRIIGDALLKLGKYQEALQHFKRNLAERKMPWALFGQARALYYLGQFDTAEDKFRQLTLDNKFFVSAYDWLAKTLEEKQDIEQAHSVLMNAVSRSPKNLLRQMELGRLSLLINDPTLAEMAYRRAVFLAKHSCFDDAEVYLQHLRSIVAIAHTGELLPRQFDNFQNSLKKLQQNHSDNPQVRADSYAAEIELYYATGEVPTAKQLIEVWLHDIESGVASSPNSSTKALISKIQAAS